MEYNLTNFFGRANMIFDVIWLIMYNIYLTIPKFRVALIFAHRAKKTIFVQEGKNTRPKTKNYIADARGARKLKPQKLKPRK